MRCTFVLKQRRSGSGEPCGGTSLIGLGLGFGLVLLHGGMARADIAVEIEFGASDTVFPNAGTTHGWQFTVNETIQVTHLGLYDRLQNGFAIEHPVGLWDEDGTLLSSVVMSAGDGDELIRNFRYVDITEDAGDGIILIGGVTYTIGFYSATSNQSDGMVIFDGFHTIDPAIEYVGFGVSDFTDGLEMPTGPDKFGLHRWGPNFQFNAVPAPPAALVFGLGMLAGRRRRRP